MLRIVFPAARPGATPAATSSHTSFGTILERGGTGHLSDLVGAGSAQFGEDGRKDNGDWEKGAPGLREKGWQDIRGLMSVSKKRQGPSDDVRADGIKMRKMSSRESQPENVEITKAVRHPGSDPCSMKDHTRTVDCGSGEDEDRQTMPASGIFKGLNMYINGSTAPIVGDHRLKQLLASHGANVSIALGRRTVTHVILGTPNGHANTNGAGGGLAATKIHREVQRVGGKGVKFVGVEWVLESIKVGKRLSEARFANLHTAAKGQRSVYGLAKS